MTVMDIFPSATPRARPPTPLVAPAIGLIAGILLDRGIQPWVALSAAATCCAAYVVWSRRLRVAPAVSAVAVFVAFVGLGAVRHALADRWWPADHILFLMRDEPSLITLRGEVISEPIIREPDPDVPRAYPVPPRTSFILKAQSVGDVRDPVSVTGNVAISIKAAVLHVRAGNQVEMTGWLYRPGGPRNPGGYDWAAHLRRDGIVAAFSCEHAESARVLDAGDVGWWRHLRDRCRARLRGYLLDDAFDEGEATAGVVSAMVLGRRSAVPRAMNEAFVRTGNAHFLAASGMHVAWLALVGWWITRLLGVYYRHAALFGALLIVSYVLLAEPRPAIFRAGIVGVIVCLNAWMRGRFSSINALAAAAIIILLLDPFDLARPAFQFTFLATIGLLHVFPRLSNDMAALLGRVGWWHAATLLGWQVQVAQFVEPAPVLQRPHGPSRSAIDWIRRTVLALFILSIAEWIVLSPLACYQFDYLALWGWLGAWLMYPFAMLTVVCGYLRVLAGIILPSLAGWMAPLVAGAAALLVGGVDLLVWLPFSGIDGRSPSLAWLLAVYGVILAWIYLPGHWTWRPGLWLAAAVLVAWWIAGPIIRSARDDGLHVWMLAVGDGTATVIELPNGRTLLYDFGTRSTLNAVAVGRTFLRERDIDRIDAAFVSHANFDHYGAIEPLSRNFPIDRVIVNDHFPRLVEPGAAGDRFLQAIRRRGIPIDETHGRFTLPDTGDVTIEAIWPPPVADRFVADDNESSIVLRISHQGRSILLTGDVSEVGIAGLLAQGDLRADVLALPHHGSVVHNTAALLAAVDPTVAVRSVGQPDRLTTNGIPELCANYGYFSTAEVGCVRITIADGRLTVWTMLDAARQ